MRKTTTILLFLLYSFVTLKAQKPDSVYIEQDYIQFIYKTDSLPIIKELYFERAMMVEVDEYPSKTQYWRDEPKKLFAYDDLDFNKNLDSLLINNQLSELIFFAPDRYLKIDEGTFENTYENKEFIRCDANNWKQFPIDSLNILLLYDSNGYTRYQERNRGDIKFESIIVPLKGNRYFYKDSIYSLKPDTLQGNYRQMLWSHQVIHDVDTFSINNKCGLYTLTGKEVIAAIYDSIKTDEVYVRAFDGEKVILFDYLGNLVKDNIKRAFPTLYTYEILDNNNQVYYMDRDGNKYDSYSFSIMSVDDVFYPIPYDVVLTPPQKNGYLKTNNYHWVSFIYLGNNEGREENEKKDMNWEREDLLHKSGIYTLLADKSMKSELYSYDFEVREIPDKYGQPLLVSGTNEFRRSGDYQSLPSSWIIAKYKGKYGVIDVRDLDNPILPFIYDKIEGNGIYLTLHKKSLKCYYPISDTPRYKSLSPFHSRVNFIRFTLPDNRKGWLLKNGEEFLDEK